MGTGTTLGCYRRGQGDRLGAATPWTGARRQPEARGGAGLASKRLVVASGPGVGKIPLTTNSIPRIPVVIRRRIQLCDPLALISDQSDGWHVAKLDL